MARTEEAPSRTTSKPLAALRGILCVVALALAAVTFLPLVETDRWWVRVLDFPRLQVTIAIAATFVALLALARFRTPFTLLALLALVAAGTWNAVQLAPVTLRPALGPTRGPAFAATSADCPAATFTVMVVNVQRGNRRADALVEIVRRVRPDILVAQETDGWWNERLAVLSDLLPHAAQALPGGDSYYGMHLFSRAPLVQPRILYPTRPETPAIAADVALPSGPLRVLAVHPRPPLLDQSSTPRDAELLWAALAVERERPTLVAGDLNAVPWETTVSRMRRLGGLLDPRREAGFLATFKADSWIMRWPLDQILHTADLRAVDAQVLAPFGSDHQPYIVTICPAPSDRPAPQPRPGDREEARATIERAQATTR